MAIVIPEKCSTTATRGEALLFEIFQKGLPSDWYVYYNLPVKGKYPDFIIIGPDLGLMVIEVKDWYINTILSCSKDKFEIKIPPANSARVNNPLEQARGYVLNIVDEVKRTGTNLVHKDGNHKGKLIFPFNYMAAFPNINEEQAANIGLHNLFERSQLLLKSECNLNDHNLSKDLPKKLKSSMGKPFDFANLSPDEFESLKKIIYDIQVPNKSNGDWGLIEILDERQLKKAQDIGPGHRLIQGVAGSGKTLVVAYRANILAANHRDWKILILCFNKTLVVNIQQLLMKTQHSYFKPKSVIHVQHFHGWCKTVLHEIGEAMPSPKEFKDDYDGALNSLIFKLLEEGRIKKGQYDAILIDEAQDFRPWWFTFAVAMLNPEQDNLIVMFDNAQRIYEHGFTWKGCGIKAQGRTQILRINYRNTAEVAELAEKVCLGNKLMVDPETSGANLLLRPEKLRSGEKPMIHKTSSLEEQGTFIAKTINELIINGVYTHNEIACIYYGNYHNGKDVLEPLFAALDNSSIPYLHIKGDKKLTDFFHDNKIAILTIHSAKGLEYKTVFLYGMEYFASSDENETNALAYVAMTRAQELLYIVHSEDVDLTDRIYSALRELSD